MGNAPLGQTQAEGNRCHADTCYRCLTRHVTRPSESCALRDNPAPTSGREESRFERGQSEEQRYVRWRQQRYCFSLTGDTRRVPRHAMRAYADALPHMATCPDPREDTSLLSSQRVVLAVDDLSDCYHDRAVERREANFGSGWG